MSSLIIGGIVSLSTAIIGFRLYNSYFIWGSYKDMVDESKRSADYRTLLSGKTIIVTGANSGIGKETARELYRHGARVVMACRNEQETKKVIAEFSKSYPESSGQLVYRYLDLTSFDVIRQFADKIKQEENNVYALINNAAIFGAPIDVTKDGFEINMQVNHLAPALLTLLLLPKLQSSTSDDMITNKVIMISSRMFKKGKLDYQLLDKIDSTKVGELRIASQKPSVVYASTKLVNLLFTRQLSLQSDLVKKVDIALASPGFTFTRLHRYVSKPRLALIALCAPFFAMILKSSNQGAQTIIGCAMANQLRSDVMYHNCKPNESHLKHSLASDTQASERVYNLTMQTLEKYVKT